MMIPTLLTTRMRQMLLLSLLASSVVELMATSYTYDTDGTASGVITEGTLGWNGTNALWNNGGSLIAWPGLNTDIAIFGGGTAGAGVGTAGTVTVGSVLAIERSQTTARYSQRTEPLFGRSGPSGSDAPRVYHTESLPPRDVIVGRGEAVTRDDIAKLPDDRYGLVMVFRTFDRASFALVMEASRPVNVTDFVTNP